MTPKGPKSHFFFKNTCVYQKKTVILRRKTQNDTIMAQETLNGLLQYVIQTLSPEDKQWFTRQLVDDAFNHEPVKPYTWDEARERLATAREQFRQGRYLTHEEVMHGSLREAV